MPCHHWGCLNLDKEIEISNLIGIASVILPSNLLQHYRHGLTWSGIHEMQEERIMQNYKFGYSLQCPTFAKKSSHVIGSWTPESSLAATLYFILLKLLLLFQTGANKHCTSFTLEYDILIGTFYCHSLIKYFYCSFIV